MTRRNKGELTDGQVITAARSAGLSTHLPVGELREQLDITECRWCSAEFVEGWSDKFCTDRCEVDYINEYHRD